MFESYHTELVGYFSKILGDSEHAKDVVQEAYLRIALMGKRAQGIMQPRAFLYHIAKRILIDEWRKEKENFIFSLKEMDHTLCDEEPLEHLLSTARIERLEQTIEKLPPRCQMAFKLHKFEGYSHKEIALRMGISKNAVEKLIIRALISCRKTVYAMNEE